MKHTMKFVSHYQGAATGLLLAMLFSTLSSATAWAESPRFSVLELPALEGGEQAQVAVNWSGELPAPLQADIEDERGEFVPLAAAQTLHEPMILLPTPETTATDTLRWQLLDTDAQPLAEARGGAANVGWQPRFHGPGSDDRVRAFALYQGDLVVASNNRIARWYDGEWSMPFGPRGPA